MLLIIALLAATEIPESLNADWGVRQSSTSGGSVLFSVANDVWLFDGTTTALLQAFDAGDPTLAAVDDVVFALGSGASPSELTAVWRRGTDFAWVWSSGGSPVLVQATNPATAGDPMNPESAAVADGIVYLVLQAFFNAAPVRHVYRVDPSDGLAVSLTGTGLVTGASRVAASGSRAAWVFDDGGGVLRLQTLGGGGAVRELDAGDVHDSSVRVANDFVVYSKTVGGDSQVFVVDASAAAPAPVLYGAVAGEDATSPQTDGWHVAWVQESAGRRFITLAGDRRFAADVGALSNQNAFLLDRGQLVWSDSAGAPWSFDSSGSAPLDIRPAIAFGAPWLADGTLVFLSGAGYRQALAEPLQAPLPPLAVSASPGENEVSLAWDAVLGATRYDVEWSTPESAGPIGSMSAAAPSAVVGGLTNNRPYDFTVRTVSGGSTGGPSRPVRATPSAPWLLSSGTAGFAFRAVALHASNATRVAAGGGRLGCAAAAKVPGCDVFASTDGGVTFAAVTLDEPSLDVRAVAWSDGVIVALSREAGAGEKILRIDGANVTVAATGSDLGQSRKGLAVDPGAPLTLFAADMRLADFEIGESYAVKSTDGGATWTHLPDFPGGELHGYAIVAGGGSIYLGGSGTPPLARSDDAGLTWNDSALPLPNYVHALALAGGVLYAGTRDNGVLASSGGTTWETRSAGLPAFAVNALVADGETLFAGTDDGVYSSADGGRSWVEQSAGMSGAARIVHALAYDAGSRLFAATDDGIWSLDLSAPPAGDDGSPAGGDPEGRGRTGSPEDGCRCAGGGGGVWLVLAALLVGPCRRRRGGAAL